MNARLHAHGLAIQSVRLPSLPPQVLMHIFAAAASSIYEPRNRPVVFVLICDQNQSHTHAANAHKTTRHTTHGTRHTAIDLCIPVMLVLPQQP